MNLTVLGAGAWGTALAVSTALRHTTLLWARDAQQALLMQSARENRRYLPGVALPEALQIDTDFDRAVAHGRDGLIVIATPMAGLHEMLQRLPDTSAGVLWLCKGFQEGAGLLGHEVARAARPGAANVGILSGPSFALEVARGQPAALVAASTDEALCQLAVEAFHSDSLRNYASSDPVGVEVGGAVKNVMAIATGIADGMQLGLNARAALITRGLAEMTRLGVTLGARAETFMGLSGLGDLVLTSTGDLSRNRKVGLLLAQGLPLAQILKELGHVAEGVACASVVLHRAQQSGVDMPITEAVVRVLDGRISPAGAIQELMSRDARRES
jgi:glycerol-3-phosphate dehydrogenase (NAD(P)+)